MQPSGNGELHLGNYLGAAKQWVALQNDYDAFYMIVNLHAITVPYEPAILKENVYKVAALYMACGVDPQKSTIFVQSLVPEHTELTWLLNQVTSMGELRRMTQFKDKADDQENASVGLFDYPVLMAADILLYQTNLVPVGEDQKQHLELTRNLAERFNGRFGETFVVPEPHIPTESARIMGLDNPAKKMSKSGAPDNFISILDTPEVIREKLKKAVTDSDNQVRYDKEQKPAISNLLTIFSAVSGKTIDQLVTEYSDAGYGTFKGDAAEAIITFLEPIQTKYNEIMADREALDALLREHSAKAQSVAAQTLRKAKDAMGVL
jgi:tryptophanyl-tRNA synthetase